MTSNHGLGDSRLQEVDSFIDEVIEKAGRHVKNSPELIFVACTTVAKH
jgi:hypothetical protein